MEEGNVFAVKVANNEYGEMQRNHVMPHCNGGVKIGLTSDLDLRRVKSMEEVTCRLKGIKVS